LLTRIVACWRRGERTVVRDLDGRQVTISSIGDQGRRKMSWLQCFRITMVGPS
jgi:hypothetical protein